MRWKKLGLVFNPQANSKWMHSHASNPVASHLEGSIYRVYFSCRDAEKRSSIGSIDFDVKKPQEILNVAQVPVVAPGEKGYFDDSGTTMGCIVDLPNGDSFLYYLGWNLCVTVPWRNSIGLAVKKAGDSAFQKDAHSPVLDRSYLDPLTVSYPWVLCRQGKWQMWYGSHTSWGERQEDLVHVIKCAESDDGINWRRDGRAVLPLKEPEEKAMSRPCVIAEAGLYKMWYSYRPGSEYRIGYAESENGVDWQRMDSKVGIDISADGWDSESVEYASIFQHDEDLFMLYNGNKYGATGFGLAILE